jgi:hypothetical protein
MWGGRRIMKNFYKIYDNKQKDNFLGLIRITKNAWFLLAYRENFLMEDAWAGMLEGLLLHLQQEYPNVFVEEEGHNDAKTL